MVFAGNYLAPVFADEILQRYPELVICHSEGEQFVLDLVARVQGRRDLSEVSAATYLDPRTKCIRRNPVREYPLTRCRFRRSIRYQRWRNGPAPSCSNSVAGAPERLLVLPPRSQDTTMAGCRLGEGGALAKHAADLLTERPAMRGRIYLCDEEFIGAGPLATTRLDEFARCLRSLGFKQPFEINTRVDSVYDGTRDESCSSSDGRRCNVAAKSGCGGFYWA